MYRDECSKGIMRAMIENVLSKPHTIKTVETFYNDFAVTIDSDDYFIMILDCGKAELYDKNTRCETLCFQYDFKDIYEKYISK